MVEITLTNGKIFTISNEVYEKALQQTYFWVDDEIISTCAIVNAKLL